MWQLPMQCLLEEFLQWNALESVFYENSSTGFYRTVILDSSVSMVSLLFKCVSSYSFLTRISKIFSAFTLISVIYGGYTDLITWTCQKNAFVQHLICYCCCWLNQEMTSLCTIGSYNIPWLIFVPDISSYKTSSRIKLSKILFFWFSYKHGK